MEVVKKVLILGSTGSIGTQALDIIRKHPEDFEVVGIAAAGHNPELVIQQAQEFNLRPEQIAVQQLDPAKDVSRAVGDVIITGEDAAAVLVEMQDADIVLNALVGSAGLESTLATLRKDGVLALANKESLVAGGQFVMEKVKPGQLVPVDSEHSAMAQCLRAGSRADVSRFVLTASGGPFRGWTREQMMEATPQQAGQHPTWSMGTMNTLNSATMVNKGLELIEATLLFGIAPDIIDVVVHPQSIVHSAITFADGATIAQASPPSMMLPISHALAWPERIPGAQPALDFSQASDWTFEPLDDEAFPAVRLAREASAMGDPYPAVYNAANEVAVEAFLAGKIRFPHIVDVIGYVLDAAGAFAFAPTSIEDILHVDAGARRAAKEVIAQL